MRSKIFNVQRFREELVASGMGKTELVEKSGVNQNAVWRMWNGMHEPNPQTIYRVASALGIDPRELVRGNESEVHR